MKMDWIILIFWNKIMMSGIYCMAIMRTKNNILDGSMKTNFKEFLFPHFYIFGATGLQP